MSCAMRPTYTQPHSFPLSSFALLTASHLLLVPYTHAHLLTLKLMLGVFLQAEGGIQQDDRADPRAAGQGGHLLFCWQSCPRCRLGSSQAGTPCYTLCHHPCFGSALANANHKLALSMLKPIHIARCCNPCIDGAQGGYTLHCAHPLL